MEEQIRINDSTSKSSLDALLQRQLDLAKKVIEYGDAWRKNNIILCDVECDYRPEVIGHWVKGIVVVPKSALDYVKRATLNMFQRTLNYVYYYRRDHNPQID